MAAFVNLSRKPQLATAWTGTAPGLPGTQTIAGTLSSPQDLSTYVRSGNGGGSVNMVNGDNFGSGGFRVQYPGIRSGDTISFDAISDFAASLLHVIVNTTLGGLGALVYVDLLATSASRSATNPSFVAAAYISQYTAVMGSVGDLAAASLTLELTGAFTYLTA